MKILWWDQLENPDARNLIDSMCSGTDGTAVTIGGFDGPHLGHKALFDAVCANALQHRHVPGIVTFIRSPGSLKKGDAYPGDVSTLTLRLRRFEELGFKFTLLIDFSSNFSKMSGGVFFDILVKKLRMRYAAVGPDFRCGHRLDTGMAELTAIAHRDGFRIDSIQQVELDGQRISSSAVRKAVQSADFAHAERLLGHPFLLDFTAIGWTVTAHGLEVPVQEITQVLPGEGRFPVDLSLIHGGMVGALLAVAGGFLRIEADGIGYLPKPEDISTARFRLS